MDFPYFITTGRALDRDEDERLEEGVPPSSLYEEYQLLAAQVVEPDDELPDRESIREYIPDHDECDEAEREHREALLARKRAEQEASDTELRGWRISRKLLARRIAQLEQVKGSSLRLRAELRRKAVELSPDVLTLQGKTFSKGSA